MSRQLEPVEVPTSMRRLPVDPKRGIPVVWFAAWIDGQPDFRIGDQHKLELARTRRLCWVCGQPLGSRRATFVIGPMCAVNRVSSEPPSHHACAVYSAMACPFMANPHRRRRESGKPDGLVDPAGQMIARNPGVAVVWVSRSWGAFAAPGGVLWDIGAPERVSWFAEGREATRAEVLASIASGLPLLRVEAEGEGASAVAEFERLYAEALMLLPADAVAAEGGGP